jgi:2-keto-4-pentenoate hydratase/2-oxohepta-3-ene-1,7-dioic acid hydratase in catechol pathway
MRLATIRAGDGTSAVRIDDDAAVGLGHPDVGTLLRRPGWRAEAAAAGGPRLQGKTFEASTPAGPWLDTDSALGEITCTVDGELMQKADTADLVFGAAALIAYVSSIITLAPGDLIATGTLEG